MPHAHHDILIVGGGCAGITVAASLLRRDKSLDVAVIEPQEDHYYQPAFTLVGAGTYPLARTKRPEKKVMPKRAGWIKARVSAFAPEQNQVICEDGQTIGYNFLVVAPGIKLDWSRIEGLQETLGKHEVCSNYLPHLAEYTWDVIRRFNGGTALFTQPPMPIKCAGAPQKIMYLAADHFRKRGILGRSELAFYNAGAVLFGVGAFVPPLMEAVNRYGIDLNFQHNLIAIDGAAKRATFAVTDDTGGVTQVTRDFDMIHVTPPQTAPDFVRESPLADEAGWVAVDPSTLRHVRYQNVFGLGDACSAPNAKTAAAIRKQAPVVVDNLLAHRHGEVCASAYDGYGSCPLITQYGRVVLAEFTYGGKVTPSLPLDPTVPRLSMWWVKKFGLDRLYWDFMLKGWEFDIHHKQKNYKRLAAEQAAAAQQPALR